MSSTISYLEVPSGFSKLPEASIMKDRAGTVNLNSRIGLEQTDIAIRFCSPHLAWPDRLNFHIYELNSIYHD